MVQPHRQALLIIDVFNDFRFEGGVALAEQFRPVIPMLVLLLEHFRGWGVPVVFVNDNFDCWHEDMHGVIAYTREVGHPVSRDAADALLRNDPAAAERHLERWLGGKQDFIKA